MKLGEGEQFAGYTIVRQLGSGGMGEVYLAQHPRLPRQEALKVLHPQISDDDIFRQRFIREADSVAALEHPNIVTVHDRGDFNGQLWIATQFVDGTDAAKLLNRYPGGLPADEVSQITAAIAQALDHAHERGVLHRDVKPANILLTQPDSDGVRRVYLADFGIARPLDDPAGLTATNFTLGTVAYAAPEQLMGKPTDGRADQYALAATAYNMLTGTTLFNESNPVAVISHHLSEPPPAPSTRDPAFAPFDAVFARALAKNPGDRYPRCQDFARALSAAAAASGVTSPTALTQQAPIATAPSTPNSPTPASPRPHDDESKRRFNILVAIVAVLLFGVAAAAILPTQIGRKSTPTPQPTSAAPSSAESQTTTLTTVPAPTPATSNAQAPQSTSQPQTTPPPRKYPPAGALGEWCSDPDGIGSRPDGTLYYCSRVQYTDGYKWSLTPGVIPNPNATTYTPPPASEVNPLGPKNGDPCTTPGVIAKGPWGLVECIYVPPVGWVWGVPGGGVR